MSTVAHDVTKRVYDSITVSGNKGSQVLPDGMAHELLQIIVVPPNTASTYRLYIQDTTDNIKVFERGDEEIITGQYNELLVPTLPLWGNNTFYLYGATNGTYKLRIVYR